jgi:hypothetical protein
VFRNRIYVTTDQWGHGAKARGQIWVYEPLNVPSLTLTAATDRVCAGGLVAIRGTGFDDFQGWKNYPELDGLAVRARKWTDGEIVAEIPADRAPGPAQIAVYRDGGTSNAARVEILPPDDARCR